MTETTYGGRVSLGSLIWSIMVGEVWWRSLWQEHVVGASHIKASQEVGRSRTGDGDCNLHVNTQVTTYASLAPPLDAPHPSRVPPTCWGKASQHELMGGFHAQTPRAPR